MSSEDEYPSFETAEERLQTFLESLGRCGTIRWVVPDDVVLWNRNLYVRVREDKEVRNVVANEYEHARARQMPIELAALCYGVSETFAFAFAPHDWQEAERNLMPEGLKLSAPDSNISCREVRGRLLWSLLWRLGRWGRYHVEFLFHQGN